jgi:ADP-ribose pyrophosphatase
MKPDDARTAYEGRLVSVTVEQWGDREREIVEHADAVAVVAVDARGDVTLVRQFREAVRMSLLELPAGLVEDGEEPLAAATRELAEETGLHGGEWRELGRISTSPGFTRERITLFAATGVERGEARPDGDEAVELVRWPLGEVARRLGEIEDAKTLVGLLLLLADYRK